MQGTDVVITAGPDPVHRDSPFTRQSRGCGRPGHFVSLPKTFLTRLNQTWATWGDPAKVFVNEWAKLRSVRIYLLQKFYHRSEKSLPKS